MEYKCAKCGGDVGNGGVMDAAVVTALASNGVLHTLFYCRRKDDDRKTKGCVSSVFSKTNTAAFIEDALDGDRLDLVRKD